MKQYRLTVNGSRGPVLSEYPEDQWNKIADFIESRGGSAILECRDVQKADQDTDTGVYHVIKNIAFTDWMILASLCE